MILRFDFAAFQIEAFVCCGTHREGLARQGAVNQDGFKQRLLWNRREEDADVVHLSCQLAHDGFPVDIVHLAGKFADIVVDKILDGAGDHVGGWVGNPDAGGLVADNTVKILLTFLRREGDAVHPAELMQEVCGIYAEHHSVDWLKVEGWVVEVDNLC